MAKNSVTDWSTTPASNTDIAGIDISENCSPSGINDAIRTLMAQIASWVSATIADFMPKTGGTFTGEIGALSTVRANNMSGDSLVIQAREDRALLMYAQTGGTNQISYMVDRTSGRVSFNSRPLFAGATPFDTSNFDPASKQNALGYTPANKAGDAFAGPISASNVEITTGDLFLSRQSNAWGYVLRPNAAGFRNLGFTTSGDAAPLDQVNFNANLVTIKNSQVWHAGNDGAGSGLDADLLDGNDSGFFTNIIARLGFTPANKAGDTFTGDFGRDANFKLIVSGGNPGLQFDTGDIIFFDRSTNKFLVSIGNTFVASIDAAGNLRCTGNITAGGPL